MNNVYKMVCVAVAMMIVAGNAWCGSDKIVVADMGRVMTAHPRTAVNRSILEKELGEFRAERENMLEKIKALREKFDETRKEAVNKALSEKAREERLAKAEEQLIGLREYQRKMQENSKERQKQLLDHRKRMGKKILEAVSKVMAEYAKKKKIKMILDSAGTSTSGIEIVLYSQDKIDVTDDIVALVEKLK